MVITLNINNPYYSDGLQDMAKAAGVDPKELCSAIITKKIRDYVEAINRSKRCMVRAMMPEEGQTDE